MTPTVIKPTVGRKVWYRPRGISFVQPNGSVFAPSDYGAQPMDATVIYVWGDRMVNLDITDHAGNHFIATSVTLLQEGDDEPVGAYAEWMPYQKGQAAKTEASEKAAAPTSNEYRNPSQREQLEWALVSGAAAHLATAPNAAGAIAGGIKKVLNELHPLPAQESSLAGFSAEEVSRSKDHIGIVLTKLPVADPGADSLEREIQAKASVAPRVTPADIEAEIDSVHFFVASDAIQHENAIHEHKDGWKLGATQLLTFCVIQLRNGFTVTGESACASPENFDAEIGRRIARENAINKVWPLLGFRLRDKLARAE